MRGLRGGFRIVVAAGLAAGLVVATTPAAHAGREATAQYVLGGDRAVSGAPFTDPYISALLYVTVRLDENCGAPTTIVGSGAACFPLEAGESDIRVRIVDASGQPVSGSLVFVARDGYTVGRVMAFCGRTAVAAPPDASAVMVGVDAVSACGAGTAATTGTIVAFFH